MLKGIFLSSLVVMIALAPIGCDLIKLEKPSRVRLEFYVESGVEHGNTVRLELRVWRSTTEEIRLRGRPAHDFVITTDNGREIWRWSHGRTIEDKMYVLTQQGVLLTGEWDQRDSAGRLVPPGSYWVKGILNLDQQQLVTERNRLIIRLGSPLVLRMDIPSIVTTNSGVPLLYWKYDLPYWKLGQKLPLKLTLKNRSDGPVSVTLRNRPAYDFVVTQAGHEIWRWSNSKTVKEMYDNRLLKPGEELEFTAEWDQRDSQGNPIVPGQYGIEGILYTEQDERLETKSGVTIGAGLSLVLSLQTPTEVESGKAVSLKLRVGNPSDKALRLRIGGIVFDFVVLDAAGKEVWRWMYGKGFVLESAPVTFQPGESKEYSVTWYQVDNEGYPVPPGTYWVKGVFRAAEQEELFETAQSEPQKFIIKP